MPRHAVELKGKPTKIQRQDVEFVVHVDGKKLGELHVSQGGVEWKPARKTARKNMPWLTLAKMMEDWSDPPASKSNGR